MLLHKEWPSSSLWRRLPFYLSYSRRSRLRRLFLIRDQEQENSCHWEESAWDQVNVEVRKELLQWLHWSLLGRMCSTLRGWYCFSFFSLPFPLSSADGEVGSPLTSPFFANRSLLVDESPAESNSAPPINKSTVEPESFRPSPQPKPQSSALGVPTWTSSGTLQGRLAPFKPITRSFRASFEKQMPPPIPFGKNSPLYIPPFSKRQENKTEKEIVAQQEKELSGRIDDDCETPPSRKRSREESEAQ